MIFNLELLSGNYVICRIDRGLGRSGAFSFKFKRSRTGLKYHD